MMHTALRATSLTLAKFLEDRLKSDPGLSAFFSVGNMVVSLNTPQEMKENNLEGLSVWLYRVIRDEERLNDPPRWLSPTQLQPPPLPVRLHYLITPITEKKQGASPETEQVILGKALQALHSRPRLRGMDLQDDFIGTEVELNVRLEALTLEEISRVWEALEGSYQLSVSYEVSVVNIASEREPEGVTPVEVVLPEYGLIVSS
jgi:hypothetical protein